MKEEVPELANHGEPGKEKAPCQDDDHHINNSITLLQPTMHKEDCEFKHP